ncbi:MAG: hypothetical protein ACHQTF_03735 [Gemmatimonadales bacterium]
MAPRSNWQDDTQPVVPMIVIIIVVTLCAVLSLGKINNERHYRAVAARG